LIDSNNSCLANEIVIYNANATTAAKLSLIADWSVEDMNFHMTPNGMLL